MRSNYRKAPQCARCKNHGDYCWEANRYKCNFGDMNNPKYVDPDDLCDDYVEGTAV